MPTNQEVLDDGTPPAPEGEDPDMGPLQRYAAALRGLYEAAAALGTSTRRNAIAVGAAVVADVVTLPAPGAVIAVVGDAGGSVGAKVIRPTGTPAAGEVQIEYDANDIPTLTFAAADAITSTTVHQLQVPAGLITHLNAEATTP